MSKQYTLPEDEQPAMVGESAVAERSTLSRHTALKYRTRSEKVSLASELCEEPSFDSPDAPCQYSIEELREILKQSLLDKANGRIHSTEEVQRMVFDKILAWR